MSGLKKNVSLCWDRNPDPGHGNSIVDGRQTVSLLVSHSVDRNKDEEGETGRKKGRKENSMGKRAADTTSSSLLNET